MVRRPWRGRGYPGSAAGLPEFGLGFRQPVEHAHIAEHRDGRAELSPRLVQPPDASVQLPKPKVTFSRIARSSSRASIRQ
jgi:hypothetical protein